MATGSIKHFFFRSSNNYSSCGAVRIIFFFRNVEIICHSHLSCLLVPLANKNICVFQVYGHYHFWPHHKHLILKKRGGKKDEDLVCIFYSRNHTCRQGVILQVIYLSISASTRDFETDSGEYVHVRRLLA